MNTKDSRPTQADNGIYCAFEVGQHVVLVDDEWSRPPLPEETFPVRGVVYTVRWVGLGDLGNVCIRLNEIVNEPRDYASGLSEACFRTYRFRPLHKLTPEAFMSADAPVKVGEPA